MIPTTILRSHVEEAIRQIDQEPAPAARAARSYAIEYEGRQYAPEYLISVAAQIATGEELSPGEFNSVLAVGYLEKLGFKTLRLAASEEGEDEDGDGVKTEEVEKLLRAWIPEGSDRLACAELLADSISWSDALGHGLWSTSLADPKKIQNCVGQLLAVRVERDNVWVTLDEASLDASALQALTIAGKREDYIFKVVTGLVCFSLPPSSIKALRPRFDPAFRRMLERVAAKYSRVTWPKAHSNAVPEALERMLSIKLPRPIYTPPVNWPAIEAAFASFRSDPAERFRVALRRRRANDIRTLLARSEPMSVAEFDREIWVFESRTLLRGQDVTGSLFGDNSVLDDKTAAEWSAALDSGDFELHGNYTWGPPGASSFSAPLTNAVNVDALLREALGVLGDASVAPIDKVKRIDAIKGFGPAVSTGLVMLVHPDQMSVWSKVADEAVCALGLQAGSLEAFEHSAEMLRTRVGAEDAFEGDRFLTVVARGRYSDLATVTKRNTPNTRTILKVAPGEQGSRWNECLEGSFICVGWDELGDLRSYATCRDLEAAVPLYFSKTYNGNLSAMTTVARDLWRLRSLKPGDFVVANQGMSKVLALGEVIAPGYEFLAEKSSFKHVVRVTWDPTKACVIPKQKRWFSAMLPLTEAFLTLLPGSGDPPDGDPPPPSPPEPPQWKMPTFADLVAKVHATEMRIDERTLRRYHIALQVRGFVILAGVSGSGKTWLTKTYCDAVGAKYELVAVAPNWTSNEDLLGYFNPLDQQYRDTPASRFLRAAANEWEQAGEQKRDPMPYHLVLDEMNLARVEHYFARFLSALELRQRDGEASIELHAGESVTLTPNVVFIGTVNVDETTHGFADKVYDRAQLIELPAPRKLLAAHMAGSAWGEDLLAIWDAVATVAPFAFRVIDDVRDYVSSSIELQVSWQDALDEQILQKVLPKLKGTDPRIAKALEQVIAHAADRFPLSYQRACTMLEGFREHGFASYF